MYTPKTRLPYFNRLSSPLQLPDRLQRAVYNGRVDKVRRLIDATDDAAGAYNIYRRNEELDMSLLHLAIVRDHLEIAAMLLDIYERDFRTLERFHADHGVQSYEWMRSPVLVACGEQKVREVRELTDAVRVLDTQRMRHEGRVGLLVLCKASNHADAEVHWCAPFSDDDVPYMARIIRALFAHGQLRFHIAGAWRNTQFAAAHRNHLQLYLRIVNTFGLHVTNSRHRYLQEVLNLCAYRDTDRPQYFEDLVRQLGGKYDFAEHLRNRHALLTQPLFINEQFDLFEWFMRTLAARHVAAGGAATIEASLQHLGEHPEDGGDLFSKIVLCDRVPEAVRAVELCWPDLLARVDGQSEVRLLSFLCAKNEQMATVAGWIVDRFEAISKQENLLREILVAIVDNDWGDGLRTLYEKCPATIKDQLFGAHMTEDCDQLLANMDGHKYAAAEFLLAAHREQFTDASTVADLLTYCASSHRAGPVLEVCLQMPGASNAIAGDPARHSFLTPLAPALRFRKLANFRSLWKTLDCGGRNAAFVRAHREAEVEGGGLLDDAIWFRRVDVLDEGPWEYVPDPAIALEIVDSDDDEDEVERKQEHNRVQLDYGPVQGPVETPAYYAAEELEYRAIFQQLLDIGCDPHAVNTAGESLVHLAMHRDNLWVLQRLIELQVDVTRADAAGMTPLHRCTGASTLRHLLQHSPAVRAQINQRDAAGDTPLLRYLGLNVEHTAPPQPQPNADCVRAFIEAGAEVNASNAQSGDTALHVALKHVEYVRLLVAGGADINARNVAGETPAHRINGNGELLLHCGDGGSVLDWLAETKKGTSILPALLTLEAVEMERIAHVLDASSEQLRELFRRHYRTRDEFGQTMLQMLANNLTWARRFVELAPATAGVDLTELMHNFYGDGGRLIARWLVDAGVNFDYMVDAKHANFWQYPSDSTWQLLLDELGVKLRLDTPERVANAGIALGEAMRDSAQRRSLAAKVEIVARFIEGGVVWRKAQDAHGRKLLEIGEIFGCLEEWERCEVVEPAVV